MSEQRKGGQRDKRVEPGRDVDVFELARHGRELQGSIALVRLSRLVDGLPEQSGMAEWAVQGEIGRGTGRTGVIGGQSLLRLRVKADLQLVCQRCNALFTYPVDAENVLQLVESEEELDDDLGVLQDESLAEEDFEGVADYPDKVVGSRHFDLLAQVEDELILSVPYVPRHEVCPGVQASNAGEAPQEPAFERPSPFAVLEQLKRKD
ncbi:YceD family protein [Bordetella sp. 2513F-2]